MNVQDRLNEIKQKYKATESQTLPNFMIIGDVSSGKTSLMRTAPVPIILNLFDPGGARVLQSDLQNDFPIYVRDYSGSKTAYQDWYKDFQYDIESGTLNEVKTYVIDSATTFIIAMMNVILQKQNRKALSSELVAVPAIQDYGVALGTMRYLCSLINGFNSSFILITHSTTEKDEETGAIAIEPHVAGKLKTELPLLFDEVYYLVLQGPKNDRKLITSQYGKYKGRTRIGANKFQALEEPNLTALLTKAGYQLQSQTKGVTP